MLFYSIVSFAQKEIQTKPSKLTLVIASVSSGSILCPGYGLCKGNLELCTDELLTGGMYIKSKDGCYRQVAKQCTISKSDTPENRTYIQKLIALFKKVNPSCTIKQSKN